MTQPAEAPRTEEFTRYKAEECPLTTRTNPVKAIRMKCLECSAGSSWEVTQCWATKCPLYVFRFGKNPFRSKVEREFTEEERAAIRERLVGARNRENSLEEDDDE